MTTTRITHNSRHHSFPDNKPAAPPPAGGHREKTDENSTEVDPTPEPMKSDDEPNAKK
jgi:hypothetical protein